MTAPSRSWHKRARSGPPAARRVGAGQVGRVVRRRRSRDRVWSALPDRASIAVDVVVEGA